MAIAIQRAHRDKIDFSQIRFDASTLTPAQEQ